MTFVLANRSGVAHSFEVITGRPDAQFVGYRCTPEGAGDVRGAILPTKVGARLTVLVGDMSWEFWEEQ
jgi:hypothetical protein